MAFQFKIQLKGISKPPVWRKVLVPDTYTFADLHEIIQTIFGWENYHLYQFTPKGYGSYPVISKPSPDDWGPVDDAAKVKLKKYFKKVGDSFVYIYDFGDDWTHQIKLEAITPDNPEHPVCTGWKGITPPEDCGGIYGYADMMEALQDPNNPEAENYREWLGLDEGETWEEANAFDIDDVNEVLAIIKQPKSAPGKKTPKLSILPAAKVLQGLPDFHHPEVLAFYKNTIHIDLALVDEIMQLPRQTLIEDLKAILQDSIDRMEYLSNNITEEEELWAPTHALMFLGALKAEEELDFLLMFLHQPKDYHDFWFSDLIPVLYWHVVYALSENQPEKLWNSLSEPFDCDMAACSIYQTFAQMALTGKYPRKTVIQMFEDHFLKLEEAYKQTIFLNKIRTTSIQIEYTSICDITNWAFFERSYHSDAVEQSILGSLKLLKELIIKRKQFEPNEQYHTIEEFYNGISYLSEFFEDCMLDEFLEQENARINPLDYSSIALDEIMKPLLGEDKIGRNDPCPCGSGKKYKKCCGNN